MRDLDGRTYAAATVDLPSLQVSALGVCVAMAVSSGCAGLEAAVLLGDETSTRPARGARLRRRRGGRPPRRPGRPGQRYGVTAAAAGTFRLGDRSVHRLGFGAMRLSGSAAMGLGAPRPVDQSVAVLRRALALGVNHVDTAAFYFSEHSAANLIIREALAPYPDDLVVVTKVGLRAPRTVTGSPGHVPRTSVPRSSATSPSSAWTVSRSSTTAATVATTCLPPCGTVRPADEGLLRHVGLSNVDAATLEVALEVTDVACVQNRHAPGYERPDTGDVLAACGEHGIAFVPFFTIAGRARESAAVEPYDAVR